jgi:hypothetical protein
MIAKPEQAKRGRVKKGDKKDELEIFYTPTLVWEWLATNIQNIFGKDFYPSNFVDPCAGDCTLSHVLEALYPQSPVARNDVDPTSPAEFHMDATTPEFYEMLAKHNAITPNTLLITNPPFSRAAEVYYQALQSRIPRAAVLVRISFIEAAGNRVEFLKSIQKKLSIVVLPRISFTNDKKTDSATTILAIYGAQNRFVKILSKEDLARKDTLNVKQE